MYNYNWIAHIFNVTNYQLMARHSFTVKEYLTYC
jgi:hypothetical protein